MRRTRKGGFATVVGFVVAGAVAGVLWALLSDPIQYTVVRIGDQSGLSADEAASTAQFGVEVTYAWIGAVIAALWGSVATWLWGRAGGNAVIVRTALGAVVGALVAWGTGVLAGPPEPTVGSRPAGATVSGQVALDAYGMLFVWPVAALLGLLLVAWLTLPREPAAGTHRDDAPLPPVGV
ncbi:hypothetical protein KV102_17600 [Mumia sp. zg.B53]|uniref:hypothetical protein n=1 Tax=unclassified Mumia TaxID=2621872 RepID=UPI001C6F5057|nr:MULTISPECIES: hypothetical protein [unclassified Mumia]MBW9211487.1 hypothetical protein [Mumia sp. zg.B21]MBW9216660.1 hypothetical protein [Mumia sp. zg.B53]MDD9350610.1 hypothetical protein [Mumia sp.]